MTIHLRNHSEELEKDQVKVVLDGCNSITLGVELVHSPTLGKNSQFVDGLYCWRYE